MTAPFARGAQVGTDQDPAKVQTEVVTASQILIGDRLYFSDSPIAQVVVSISEEQQNSVPVRRIASETTQWIVPAGWDVRRDVFTGEDDPDDG